MLPNDLPFSSERLGRFRAYHGRKESRAQPAASRHEPTSERKGVAFGCCNGGFDSERDLPRLPPRTVDPSAKDPTPARANDRWRSVLIGHCS